MLPTAITSLLLRRSYHTPSSALSTSSGTTFPPRLRSTSQRHTRSVLSLFTHYPSRCPCCSRLYREIQAFPLARSLSLTQDAISVLSNQLSAISLQRSGKAHNSLAPSHHSSLNYPSRCPCCSLRLYREIQAFPLACLLPALKPRRFLSERGGGTRSGDKPVLHSRLDE